MNVVENIDVVGTTITVHAGSFVVGTTTYTIQDDLTYTYTPSTYGGNLFVYVVLDQSSNPSIMFDWVDAGPSGVMYEFVPGGAYALVMNCLALTVAANASDLSASKGLYISVEMV